ncbi:MAG TPA: discoidin domain-containing protein [Actinocrinis sp.]|uniref:discoidin domain-containing protein n=1 Tax=Actinocrinis sp. TaxID=1920516 RepID=UPI002DDD855F|nr:discoidin domain-containing protein [Actinocrinis sp.]HEV3171273.1 discoidin domain-containing protein [Actinocrinis sp.]
MTFLTALALAGYALVAQSTPAHAASTLLSQGQPATASSLESSAYPASNAVDGNPNTRWSSAWGSDPQWLQVDLGSSATISQVVLIWENAYATAFQIQTSTDATNWTSIYSTTAGAGGTQTLSVSGSGRYVRMYGTARATGYGYSLWEFQVYGTAGSSSPPSCGTTNVALNQPATASSIENGGTPASAAVDGNTGTRWSSQFSDPQWLQVDLGSTQNICQVVLDWETAYASAFQIQVSNDATNWTSIYSTTAGTGGTQTLNVSGSGRYVRMYGTARATQWGYSLWEFEVFAAGLGSSGGGNPNWSTVWSDNFAGAANTAPSSSNWIEDTGTSAPGGPANWGTGEVETMSNSTGNVYLDGNNHLDIKAIDTNGSWTSGRIESQRSDFAAPAGGMLQISASIEQPNPTHALGYWPAFWTLGAGDRTGGAWPAVGESDIMEAVNGRSQVSGTLHCGTDPGGACNEATGRTSGLTYCAGCQTAYHTYSEIIDRTKSDEQIRWYVDGQQFWQVSESQVGVSTWQAAVDHGFFIIFDLAIGGAFPNADCGCTSPNVQTSSGGVMSIDSVTVQQATGTAPPPLTTPNPPANNPSVVKVTGSQGNWSLSVNGAPYEIKGMTYGPSTAAASTYLPDLAAMGVNTVRTWGTDSTTQPLLDAATANGIKVINGFWLSQSDDYVNDTTYKNNQLNTIVGFVNQYKNDGAVLMWDVGNEVILSLQNTYSGAQLEAERNAYAQFVDQVAQAIHAADPNHPVTSTDAWVGAWPYYKANSPNLDLYAVNSYGAVCNVQSAWNSGGYTKPYIVTESGPAGEWEVPNDANGVPQEDTDQQSANGYATAWGCITGTSAKGVALGATLFNYGVENDFGGIWFNVVTGGWRRLSYYTVSNIYGGTATTNQAPVITGLTVGNASAVPAGGQFTVNVAANSPTGATLRYGVNFNSKYINSATALQGATFTAQGGNLTITAPNQIGVWKVNVYVYDGLGNVGIQTASFKVVPPPVNGTNVAIGKPTTASSYQATGNGAPYPPSNATDGNLSTRWASDWSDPQWIQVDLGQTTTISHIQLVWEAAYGQAYQIQTSPDGTNWTTIYSTTTGVGGVDDFNVSGSGRYVRLYGTARGTTFGYSLYEFGIYS